MLKTLIIMIFFCTMTEKLSANSVFFRYSLADSLEYTETVLPESDFIEDGFPGLTKRGVIYRGVNIGSGSGTSLNSAFSLELGGKIGDDLEISGFISDDRLSLEGDGSTELLSGIEKVHISFRHPFFFAVVGDYNYSNHSGVMGNLDRDYSGVHFSVLKDNYEAEVFLSAENSEFMSTEFIGMEGVNGPYTVLDKNRRVTVKSGSETVYLNGTELQRGTGYFFDYFSSELWIRNQHSIKKGDRIVIDYMSPKNEYERLVYGTGATGKVSGGRYGFTFHYYSESDDESGPLGFDLDDRDKNEMYNAGNVREVLLSGAEYAPGKGDYDLIYPDSLHYVFRGVGKGDYKVRFSNIGEQGDYYMAYDSLGHAYFVYDQFNGGDYMPLVAVKTPEKYSRVHGSASFNSERVKIETEIAVSEYNKNTFGPASGNETGFGDVQKILLRSGETPIGNFELGFERTSKDSLLVLPSRFYRIEGQDELNTSQYINNNSFLAHEGFLRYYIGEIFSGQVKLRDRSYGNDISERGGTVFTENSHRYLKLKSRTSFFELEKDTVTTFRRSFYLRADYETAKERMRFSPYFRHSKIYTQNTVLQDNETTDTGGTEIGINLFENTDIVNTTEYSFEKRSGRTDIYAEDKLNRLSNTVLVNSRVGTLLTSELRWTTVSITDPEKKIQVDRYDLVNIRGNYNKMGRYRVYADYGTERSLYTPRIRTYYQVPEGTGNYRLIDGEYVRDEYGNYDYTVSFSDVSRSLTGVELNIRSFFNFRETDETENILFWLSRFDLGQDLTVTERSRSKKTSDLALLNLSKFQNDSTVTGSIESYTTVHFMRRNRNSFEYNLTYRKNRSQEYLNFSENGLYTGHRLTFRNTAGNFSNTLTGIKSVSKRYASPGPVLIEDIESDHIQYIFRHNYSAGSNYSLNTEFGMDREKVKGISSRSIKIAPSFTSNIKNRSVIRAECKLIRVFSEDKITVRMSYGAGKGTSLGWNGSAVYEFSESISGTLLYSGRKFSYDSKPFHTLSIEFKMDI